MPIGPLKFFLIVLGIIIIIFSFLLDDGENDFSPSYESKENIYKKTPFTKLTNFARNVYALLIVVFIFLLFFLPKSS